MTLSSSAFAQTGADSDIFYNARIVFSDQHTMYFQLALGPGQGASQGSCFVINGEEWLALTSLGSDQAGISHWAFPFQSELTIQPTEGGQLEGFIRQNGNEASAFPFYRRIRHRHRMRCAAWSASAFRRASLARAPLTARGIPWPSATTCAFAPWKRKRSPRGGRILHPRFRRNPWQYSNADRRLPLPGRQPVRQPYLPQHLRRGALLYV